MKKILTIFFLAWNLQAQDFENFLDQALKRSPYLKALFLKKEQAKERSMIVQRYKNPSISLEASRFDPQNGSQENGFRSSISQPIRLWGIQKDRQSLGSAIKTEAMQQIKLQRAEFIKEISLRFVTYKRESALYNLAKEELAIAKKIADISLRRFNAGTITKARYLLAQAEVLEAQKRVEELNAKRVAALYKLLAFAGFDQTITLNPEYRFSLKIQKDIHSPKLASLQSRQKRALQEAKLNSHKIEWINLYAEFEKEPDQDIARVGIEIPLAIFNKKSQEQRIAYLRAKQQALLIKNEQTKIEQKLKQLRKTISILRTVLQKNSELLKRQKELLKMYEQGYKIAQIDLIELQSIKNKMIQTKKEQINLEAKIDTNTILYNYETGAYND